MILGNLPRRVHVCPAAPRPVSFLNPFFLIAVFFAKKNEYLFVSGLDFSETCAKVELERMPL